LFEGSTRNIPQFSCHVSVLDVNHTPHPPHVHADEELLLLLHGKAQLILPETKQKSLTIEPGEFVYYPANFSHTLKSIGKEPANYLMLKWQSGLSKKNGLSFQKYETKNIGFKETAKTGMKTGVVFEGNTKYLNKLHCHITRLQPGGGYKPHKDAHDVVIIMLNGKVKTEERILQKHGVAIHSAGVPHGIENIDQADAEYIVFEFHGKNKQYLFYLFRFIKKLIRFIISPKRWVSRAKKIKLK